MLRYRARVPHLLKHMARICQKQRKTKETDISVSLEIHSLSDHVTQEISVDTGIGFLDHVDSSVLCTPHRLVQLSVAHHGS